MTPIYYPDYVSRCPKCRPDDAGLWATPCATCGSWSPSVADMERVVLAEVEINRRQREAYAWVEHFPQQPAEPAIVSLWDRIRGWFR